MMLEELLQNIHSAIERQNGLLLAMMTPKQRQEAIATIARAELRKALDGSLFDQVTASEDGKINIRARVISTHATEKLHVVFSEVLRKVGLQCGKVEFLEVR